MLQIPRTAVGGQRETRALVRARRACLLVAHIALLTCRCTILAVNRSARRSEKGSDPWRGSDPCVQLGETFDTHNGYRIQPQNRRGAALRCQRPPHPISWRSRDEQD